MSYIKLLIASWTEDELKSETNVIPVTQIQDFHRFALPLHKVKEYFEGPAPQERMICLSLRCPWTSNYPAKLNALRKDPDELARLVNEEPDFTSRLILGHNIGTVPLEMSKYERCIEVMEGAVLVLYAPRKAEEQEAEEWVGKCFLAIA
ncbi:hypothetical protein FSARC_7154 [Fusarium sarcochroum]|uniref:Uncharacterized protein n=1 Tax=Fusarium sarcochroum TaxID=1208366 RepID=A0A8H4TVR9_9HYPO|nr:hypothetical protein FSARC_7154 [Fusarium sarcochroum]